MELQLHLRERRPKGQPVTVRCATARRYPNSRSPLLMSRAQSVLRGSATASSSRGTVGSRRVSKDCRPSGWPAGIRSVSSSGFIMRVGLPLRHRRRLKSTERPQTHQLRRHLVPGRSRSSRCPVHVAPAAHRPAMHRPGRAPANRGKRWPDRSESLLNNAKLEAEPPS